MCQKPHQPPIDFLADVFFGKSPDAILWGNRGGGKSYIGGFISWLRSTFKKRCGTRILGGSSDQAEKVYKAMSGFLDKSGLMEELLDKPPLISSTQWKNGSNVEILTASQRSVRGPHQQNLIIDEVEEMDEDLYEAALSQPQSAYGIQSSTIIMSTLHRRFGLFKKILEDMKGFQLYRFCIFDVLGSCKDYYSESGCKSVCPLAEYCPGKQIRDSQGHYPFPDLIKKLNFLSLQSFRTEWLCEEPSAVGAIYPEFSQEIHVIDIGFDATRPVQLGIDFGGVNAFAVCIFQYFEDLGDVQVDEVYIANTTNQEIIAVSKSKPWWNSVTEVYADPSRADLIMEWKAALPNVRVNPADNKVAAGINEVKNALKPVLGPARLFFSKKCKNSIREMESYHMKGDNPAKEEDHTCDAIRYRIMGKKSAKPQVFVFSESKTDSEKELQPALSAPGVKPWERRVYMDEDD